MFANILLANKIEQKQNARIKMMVEKNGGVTELLKMMIGSKWNWTMIAVRLNLFETHKSKIKENWNILLWTVA